MARPKNATFEKAKVVAENRRARYDYHIEDTYEAGIALTGTEVKSLRFGEGSIAESYAEVRDNQVWLVPLSVYFNGRGRAKVELALAKGKKAPDKRATEKERDWKREQGRLLRDRG